MIVFSNRYLTATRRRRMTMKRTGRIRKLYLVGTILAAALILLSTTTPPNAQAESTPPHGEIAQAIGELNSLRIKQASEIKRATNEVEGEHKKNGKLKKNEKLKDEDKNKIVRLINMKYDPRLKDVMKRLKTLRGQSN